MYLKSLSFISLFSLNDFPIIPWLKDNYNNCEVIAVCCDLGQGDDMQFIHDKAIKTGATTASLAKCYNGEIRLISYPVMS